MDKQTVLKITLKKAKALLNDYNNSANIDVCAYLDDAVDLLNNFICIHSRKEE